MERPNQVNPPMLWSELSEECREEVRALVPAASEEDFQACRWAFVDGNWWNWSL
jgi:hypothetical protein